MPEERAEGLEVHEVRVEEPWMQHPTVSHQREWSALQTLQTLQGQNDPAYLLRNS